MSAACEVSLNWDGKPPLCGEPALFEIAGACVHEHVATARVCSGCLADLRMAGEDETWECDPCATGREPHVCLMPITVMEIRPGAAA